ncbi:diguanylate cyclase [Variovorax sp. PCZ-1]|uniref:diguanylate cyclase domain-containing protein n=1 Tax=Variovorax sp. PCZ-1 TaxID=2835533 RepID=UPI001BCCE033|nr:diguanylate cyclase [Variovorax sp. PCZ-1]MBS7806770.1 diguanylate cyclase [Variovorax sp. PCZ-1]
MLDQQHFILWALLLGAYIPLLFYALFEFVRCRARWAGEVFLYASASAAYILTASGFAASLPSLTSWFSNASYVLWYPSGVAISLVVAIGAIGVRNWLGIKMRDRVANIVLLGIVYISAGGGLLVLAFEPIYQQCLALGKMHLATPVAWLTPLALSLGILGLVVTSVMSARAAVLGDAEAWQGFLCGLSCAPVHIALALQELFQISFASSFWMIAIVLNVVGMMILLRAAIHRAHVHTYFTKLLDSRIELDLITRLPIGVAMVKAMEHIYVTSLRFKRRPVTVMVKLSNTKEIVQQFGENGLNEVLLATVSRIRKITSPADLMGRYYGACFAVQISGKVSAHQLWDFGLRLAAATAKPVELKLVAQKESVLPIVGVGICWCNDIHNFTEALYEAERAANVAVDLHSRAAVTLFPNDEPKPLEAMFRTIKPA